MNIRYPLRGSLSNTYHRSSGNITSQRANIRAKLGLKKSDNLKEALQERMRLYEEEHRQEDFSAMR